MPDLIESARIAATRAYAPYSGFAVGAAIEFANGIVVSGVNVENGAYPLGSCAERAAVSAGIAAGGDRIVRVAIYSPSGDAPPCGGCRQVISEFATPDCEVSFDWLGTPTRTGIADLLPFSFAL